MGALWLPILVACCVLSTGCGDDSGPVTPTPSTPSTTYTPVPSYHATLSGGGELRIEFTDFSPARGQDLRVGATAWVVLEYFVPPRNAMVWFEAVGSANADGTQVIPTSFFGTSPQIGIPICAGQQNLGGSVRLGHDNSARQQYPGRDDPAVSFVRIRVWVVDVADCRSLTPMQPPMTAPSLVAVERLDWGRPR